jgi:hypothetical protein
MSQEIPDAKGLEAVWAVVAKCTRKVREMYADFHTREAEVLEGIEREKAKRRQATSTGGAKPQLVDARPQAEGGKSRDSVAEAVGIGSGCDLSRAPGARG